MTEPQPISFAEWVKAQGLLDPHPSAITLKRMYEEEYLSDVDIADHFGVGHCTVARWRRKYGIPSRTMAASRKLVILKQRFDSLNRESR